MEGGSYKIMLNDPQYKKFPFRLSEVTHNYGPNVRILSNPYINTILSRLCESKSTQPVLNHYIDVLYTYLTNTMVAHEFPKKIGTVVTRMADSHDEGTFETELIDEKTRAITIDVARAGTYPSHVAYNILNYLLDPKGVRQDHLYVNRKINNKGEVVGVEYAGSKIGGDKEGAVVIIPDPMGATGGTTCHALNLYKKQILGKELKFIAAHLIVTPEYIKRVTKEHPDLIIYALRFDRGLSPKEILKSTPGTHPESEKGLNEFHYIVPGAGGIGELLNNSY